MIYDCFTFFNELDLLEIRLNELDGVVDRFVLVEATRTHNGEAKPLYYAENKSRFARFNDKIIHIVVDDFSAAETGLTFQERAWMRENIQRNAISNGLVDAKPDDFIIVSDLDEIPRVANIRDAVHRYNTGEVVSFELRFYGFYLNLRNVSDPFWGNDPKMADYRTFCDAAMYGDVKYTHFILPGVNQGGTATRFRYVKPVVRIHDAGWHFSYLGGLEAVVKKIRAFNEMGLYNKENIEKFVEGRIAAGRSLWGHDHFMPEPIDDTFPEYVRANCERFSRLVYASVPEQGIKIKSLRKFYRAEASVRRFVMHTIFRLTPKCVRSIVKQLMGIER